MQDGNFDEQHTGVVVQGWPKKCQSFWRDILGVVLFPDRSHSQYFILEAMKHWQWERPGNEATLGASAFVMGIVHDGYVLPLLADPTPVCFRNRRSALLDGDFVHKEISNLLKGNCVVPCVECLQVCNPLWLCLMLSTYLLICAM